MYSTRIVAFRSLLEKTTTKSDSFKKRNQETFDSGQSGVPAILPVHMCDAKLRRNRRAKSSYKFRTVNIPKLHRATVQDFLRFVLFFFPPAREPIAIGRKKKKKVKGITRYEQDG